MRKMLLVAAKEAEVTAYDACYSCQDCTPERVAMQAAADARQKVLEDVIGKDKRQMSFKS